MGLVLKDKDEKLHSLTSSMTSKTLEKFTYASWHVLF